LQISDLFRAWFFSCHTYTANIFIISLHSYLVFVCIFERCLHLT
jgi:hypothetical protein